MMSTRKPESTVCGRGGSASRTNPMRSTSWREHPFGMTGWKTIYGYITYTNQTEVSGYCTREGRAGFIFPYWRRDLDRGWGFALPQLIICWCAYIYIYTHMHVRYECGRIKKSLGSVEGGKSSSSDSFNLDSKSFRHFLLWSLGLRSWAFSRARHWAGPISWILGPGPLHIPCTFFFLFPFYFLNLKLMYPMNNREFFFIFEGHYIGIHSAEIMLGTCRGHLTRIYAKVVL